MTFRMMCTAMLLACGATPAMAHDALLEQALNRAALMPGDMKATIRTTTTVSGSRDGPEVETETVDPRKDPKKVLASYDELRDVVGKDAHVVSSGAARTTYAFTTHHVPQGFAGAGTVGIHQDDEEDTFDGTAEVSLDATGRPYVSHLDLRLHGSMGNIIARVKKIDLSYAFVPATDSDRMMASAMTVDVAVRALFFVHRSAHADSVVVPDP